MVIILLSLFAIILSLLLVVGIHELGHALAARWFNVRIKKISLGFGKPLLCWQGKSDCQWVWALWPLGGYVNLLNTRIAAVDAKNYPFCFDKKPIWVRCIILLSGAFANLLTAALALILLLMIGYQQIVPVIAEVAEPSMAATAGLKAGDKLKAIAGHDVASWREAGMYFIRFLGQNKVSIIVERGGAQQGVQLDLSHWHYQHGKNALLGGMGISPDLAPHYNQQVEGVPLLQACQQALEQMSALFYFFLILLKQLFLGIIPFSVLLGPFAVFSAIISSFLQGFTVFLAFIANMSMAVAFVNLLPIPGLDGGSLVYALVEKLSGRPISVGIEVLLHRLIFIAFCLVLVQLLLNDFQG